MARGLEKLDHLQVLVAGTLDEGLAEIDSKGVDLILSDLDLPGRPGVELFGELARRELQIPIVFLSAYLEAYRSSLPPNGSYEVYEKPVPLSELREILKRKLGTEEKSQEMAPFGILDYLQLACLGRHSVKITAKDRQGMEGKILVQRGEIWHAEDSEGTGPEAFNRLILATEGVGCSGCNNSDVPERSIFDSWESLMIRAAAMMDEGQAEPEERAPYTKTRHDSFDIPPGKGENAEKEGGDAPPRRSQEEKDIPFEELVDLGTEALLTKDYSAALLFFQEAEKKAPGNGLVKANLERLQAMGVQASDAEGDREES